jgi:hypothetical protein
VERPGELHTLRQLRVPLVQGYLLGRPAQGFAALAPAGAGVLAAAPTEDDPEPTLRNILEDATWITDTDTDTDGDVDGGAGGGAAVRAHALLRARPDVEVVILVDPDGRPTGSVDRTTPPGGMRRVWRAWAGTPLRDLARRIGTRPAEERFAATVCCDAAGRFLGLVRVERLLFELSG